jgi:hypothetical protein
MQMSDLALIKNLDGFPAAFVRFQGAGNLVVCVNAQFRTVTRDYWRSLPIYQEGTLALSNHDRLSG